jgi:pimeloyl-ACP methyl ester carboxylesterase
VASRERVFQASSSQGDLVGHIREAHGKPNALLLHGGPGLGDYLETLADELDGILTTARYQQRGLTPSTLEGDRSVGTHVADAVAVMDALGWPKPIVVGHSWGGHLALHVAVAHPDRIDGVVTLDALGPAGDGGIELFGAALMAGLSDAAVARISQLDAQGQLTPRERGERLGILWPNYFGDPLNAPPMPELRFDTRNVEAWESINAHLSAGTLEQGLTGVTARALIIHGERSPMPLAQAQRIVELMPNATLVAHEGKGHWAWLEEPGFVRKHVERFLARN